MILTAGQQKVLLDFASGENILLLGDPGTGKSTLIETIVNKANKRGLNVARTASTGIAAQLIGGRTIHSLLKAIPRIMKTEAVDYDEKASGLANIDVLIIDEISMLGQKFICYLYNCLAHAGRHIQLILAGDFFQLPPVKDCYAFTSPCWNNLNLRPNILTEVVRQKDTEFVQNINLLKYGDKRCLNYLLSHSSSAPLNGHIAICATRYDAQLINRAQLEELPGIPQVYLSECEGTVSTADTQIEDCLVIKDGMRVMSIINGTEYSNGSLGTVLRHTPDTVEVLFDSGADICFEKICFTVERTDRSGETVKLWQIPLRPAYAITIHKSQGQTFEYLNIDGTKCWAPGQLYVAVSRAKRIEGIHFLTPIKEGNIRTNPTVLRFYEKLESQMKGS